MRDLPGSGIEPVSPALAGGFFTTDPPWKPLNEFLKAKCELASVEQLELQHTGILHLFTSYFHGSLPGVDEKDWGRSQKARGSPTQWHRHAGDYLLLLRGLHLVSHACLHSPLVGSKNFIPLRGRAVHLFTPRDQVKIYWSGGEPDVKILCSWKRQRRALWAQDLSWGLLLLGTGEGTQGYGKVWWTWGSGQGCGGGSAPRLSMGRDPRAPPPPASVSQALKSKGNLPAVQGQRHGENPSVSHTLGTADCWGWSRSEVDPEVPSLSTGNHHSQLEKGEVCRAPRVTGWKQNPKSADSWLDGFNHSH